MILNRQQRRTKKAFTIVEMLIAASIFVALSTLAATILIDVMRVQRKLTVENSIYEDARFMMERISREIRLNAIDYEEYYNQSVDDKDSNYGNHFGCYASRFYYPGLNQSGILGALGALCNDGNLVTNSSSCIIDKDTLDINSGMNPYGGANKATNTASAFCDNNHGGPNCGINISTAEDKLYLISPDGSQKTIMALKSTTGATTPEHALSVLKINGKDVTPKDGIFETWFTPNGSVIDFQCANGFNCPNTGKLSDTLNYNGTNLYSGFVPISPLRTNVVSVKFIIAPIEDPRKAFAESDPTEAIQQQPHVTVILTVAPAQSEVQKYGLKIDPITLQNTITSRVYHEIPSYDGKGHCNKGYNPF